MEHTKMDQRKIDEMYMRRCLQLARNGMVGAPPNPMVGAVVVCQGRVIGEGYHQRCGGPHAEVNALRSVKHPELLTQSTIYVSLEPCAHYGKTPPCADLIVEKRIPRVVVGCRDPFAKVDGLGIKKLRDAGCEVVVGVLEQECLALNRRFMTFHTHKRPFITLKWAQSADGYLGVKNAGMTQRTVFSTRLTTSLVHQLRAESDAILVGGATVLADNPSLTVRHWPGDNPLRVVIDTRGNLPKDALVFNDEAPTMTWSNWNLDTLMHELYERGVQKLLVEGGAATLQRFIDADLWDEIRIETSPVRLGLGVPAPQLPRAVLAEQRVVDGHTITLFRHPAQP